MVYLAPLYKGRAHGRGVQGVHAAELRRLGRARVADHARDRAHGHVEVDPLEDLVLAEVRVQLLYVDRGRAEVTGCRGRDVARTIALARVLGGHQRALSALASRRRTAIDNGTVMIR